MKNDVKGGIVIDQLKRYAKKLSDVTDAAASVEIAVMQMAESSDPHIQIRAWISSDRRFVAPVVETGDLRDLGSAIDEYIRLREKAVS